MTVTACGWCPPAAAIITYEPAPGTLSAYRPSSPLAPRPIWVPCTSMSVSAARGTVLPSWCWTVPQTGTPGVYACGAAPFAEAAPEGEGEGEAEAEALRAAGTAVDSAAEALWDTSGFSLRKQAMSRPSRSTGTR